MADHERMGLLADAFAEQIERLLRYLDDALSPDEQRALTDELRNDADLRRLLALLAVQSRTAVSINQIAAPGQVSPSPMMSEANRRGRHSVSSFRFQVSPWLIAASLLIASGVALIVFLNVNPQSEIRNPQSQPVALLTDLRNATFARSPQPTTLGSELRPGVLKLQTGKAQIMFSSGAVVDLTAPCTFEMVGTNHARLHRGELSAMVNPEAHGFTVDTPHAHVVDLGTEFTLGVNTLGELHLQVLTGRVQLSSGEQSRIVTENTAYRVLSPGRITPAAFIVEADNPWRDQTAAWYRLDGDGLDASGHDLDLQAGRSPFTADGSAPNFGQSSDGLVQLTRKLTADELSHFATDRFTIEAWVRNPADKTDHNGIFAYRNGGTDRFQFTISRNALRLDYQRGDTGAFYNEATTGPLTWQRDVWYHVVVTYDAGSAATGDSVIRFYRTALRGEHSRPETLATLRAQPDLTPLTVGGMLRLDGFDDIGTRNFGGSIAGVRYINQCLDENQVADLARNRLFMRQIAAPRFNDESESSSH